MHKDGAGVFPISFSVIRFRTPLVPLLGEARRTGAWRFAQDRFSILFDPPAVTHFLLRASESFESAVFFFPASSGPVRSWYMNGRVCVSVFGAGKDDYDDPNKKRGHTILKLQNAQRTFYPWKHLTLPFLDRSQSPYLLRARESFELSYSSSSYSHGIGHTYSNLQALGWVYALAPCGKLKLPRRHFPTCRI